MLRRALLKSAGVLAAPLWQAALKALERVATKRVAAEHAECREELAEIKVEVTKLRGIVDFLLSRLVPDGRDTDRPTAPAE